MTRYEALTEDIQNLQKDVEQNAMTWSEEDRNKKEEEARALRQEYETTVHTLQNARQQVMQVIMQQMRASTSEVLEGLIEDEKIGVVVCSDAFYDATVQDDITERVIQPLKQRAQEQHQ